MTKKFTQSWQLFKASISVTLRHRKLLWFPVLTGMMTALIAFFFLAAIALPVVLRDTGYHLNQKQHWVALQKHYFPESTAKSHPHPAASTPGVLRNLIGNSSSVATTDSGAEHGFPWGSVCCLGIYLCSMFLATFFNVAFYSEIIAALNGRGVSFRRGLRTAWSRLPSILAWSLLAGAVGWIIRLIEERVPFAARILTGLVGLAWSIAAVFAIPVIIQEQPVRNPIKILQQSAATLKRTWGEGLIGCVGFSAGSVVIFACSLVPLAIAGVFAILLKSVPVIVAAGALWLIALFFIGYVSGVASHVFRCALYIYAAEGVVPEPYNERLLEAAWKIKPRSE